jgi:hypothetical protein
MDRTLAWTSPRGLTLLLACFALTGCAKGYVAEKYDADVEEPPRIPTSIETVVNSTTLSAGNQLSVECRVYDQFGNRMLELTGATPRVVHEPQYLFETGEGGALIAAKAGTGTVACTFAQFGLFDDGVDVTIVAGPAHSVITRLDDDQIVAGGSASATCFVYDAYGNEIADADATLSVSPSSGGVEVEGLTTTITRSGTYEVSCSVSGALQNDSDFLQVDPALPHSMTVGLRPDRAFYKVGDQVLLEADVRDRYGNRVTGATLAYSEITNNISSQDGARFSFVSDGATVLRAIVTSAIDLSVAEVSATVSVVVNTTGPQIECLRIDDQQPSDAYMVNLAPGGAQVPVRISDTFNVQSVRISGNVATHTGGGVYQGTHDVTWGINFVDVVATDEHGLENSRTCFFLASNRWTPENDAMTGAVGFKLTQAAVGPGTPGELTTLNEILRVVLNSPGLKAMVDAGIPELLNSGSCGVWACEPDVTYNRGSINWDPVTTLLALINGGLSLEVRLPNARLTVRACGTACCIGGSTITARVSLIRVNVDISLQLINGVLRAGIIGTPDVSVSTPSLDGSGFCGFLVNLIQGFFTGAVRDAIRDALQDFLGSEVGPLLDDLVSSLDISSLGASFDVPRLDGSGNITLSFGTGISSLSITANDRALVGIDTRFSASPIAHNRPTLGVPRRTDAILLDLPVGSPRTIGISFYEGALNQVLHALWRGGFVQANLELAENTSVTIDSYLPPVAHIQGNAARLMLGGVLATVQLPIDGMLPFQVMFGGVAGATATLEGDELVFGNITLDVENDLYITFLSDSIPESARDILTGVLGTVVRNILLDAVNDGLPAIPIPTFTLPADLADFGLPANAEIGITSPILEILGNHFRLQGGFGVR